MLFYLLCLPGLRVLLSECASSPCSNDGICTDGVNRFVCACPDTFTGVRCLTPVPVPGEEFEDVPPRILSLEPGACPPEGGQYLRVVLMFHFCILSAKHVSLFPRLHAVFFVLVTWY